MSDERELKRVPRCLLPVNNLSLEPEYFGERWAGPTSVCPARRAGFSMIGARWGHMGEARRLREPVKAAEKADL